MASTWPPPPDDPPRDDPLSADPPPYDPPPYEPLPYDPLSADPRLGDPLLGDPRPDGAAASAALGAPPPPPPSGQWAASPPVPAPAPPARKRLVGWWIAAAALGVAGVACTIGAVALLFSVDDDSQFVGVPGSGTVVIDEAGTWRISYESSQYLDNGTCESRTVRRGTGENRRTVTERSCDEDVLAAAGEPTLRLGSGDREPLTRSSPSVSGTGIGVIRAAVWEADLTRTGTYELAFADAPAGTERLAIRRVETDPRTVIGILLLPLAMLFVFAGLVLVVVTAVRSSRGGRPPAAPVVPGARYGGAGGYPTPTVPVPPVPPPPVPPGSFPPPPVPPASPGIGR